MDGVALQRAGHYPLLYQDSCEIKCLRRDIENRKLLYKVQSSLALTPARFRQFGENLVRYANLISLRLKRPPIKALFPSIDAPRVFSIGHTRADEAGFQVN